MANKVRYLLSAMTSGRRERLSETRSCSGAAWVRRAVTQPAAVVLS